MKIDQRNTESIKIQKGTNYSSAAVGKFADLDGYQFVHPKIGKPRRGKLFLREMLDMTSMQISLNKLAPGIAVPFTHKHHQNEELYVFVKGTGQMQVDGEIIEVCEGTCVRIATAGSRTWRNTGSEDLYYIVLQARENSLQQDTFDDGIPEDAPISWPE